MFLIDIQDRMKEYKILGNGFSDIQDTLPVTVYLIDLNSSSIFTKILFLYHTAKLFLFFRDFPLLYSKNYFRPDVRKPVSEVAQAQKNLQRP